MCVVLAGPGPSELLCFGSRFIFCSHEGDEHRAPALILQMASESCDPEGYAAPPLGLKSQLYSILNQWALGVDSLLCTVQKSLDKTSDS